MMIFSLVAMTGLEKCCITSAYLQWLCHSGERPVVLLYYEDPLMDFIHIWPDGRYRSKVFISTNHTPWDNLGVKVTDLEFS